MPSLAAAAVSTRAVASLAPRPAQARLPSALRPAPPQNQPQQRQRHPQGTRRLPAAKGGGGPGRQPPAQQQQQLDPVGLLKQYGLPMLGLLAGALMIEPVLVGLIFLERVSVTLLGVAGVFACVVAAVSLLWLAIPALASIFGMSTVVTAGVAAVVLATAAAGVLKVPALVPLVLLASGFLALAFQGQKVFAGGAGGGSGSTSTSSGGSSRSGSKDDPRATIDVEADPVQQEASNEQREREAELAAFDELLSSRDEGKQRSGPPFK